MPNSPANGSAEPISAAGSALTRNLNQLFHERREPSDPPMSNAAAAAAITRTTGIPISPSYLWHLRTGSKSNPTLQHLLALAKFFEISFADLIADDVDYYYLREHKVFAKLDSTMRDLVMRASGLLPESRAIVTALLDHIRELQRLPPIAPIWDDVSGEPR